MDLGVEPARGARGARPCRILVVDDHPIVRQGMRHVASSSGGRAEVVGEAGSARQAVEAARQLCPDVVLLDLRLPDMLASEAVALLRGAAPGVRVLLFSAGRDQAAVNAALAAGVDGCVMKDAGVADLLDALIRVGRGEQVLDHRVSGDLRLFPSGQRAVGLTRREYEVLRHVARGKTNAEIARELMLSCNTVKTYFQCALQKLGARNRVEAVARAEEAGLL